MKKNLVGSRFSRWLVLKPAQPASDGRSQWLCRCDCGIERAVRQKGLVSGKSNSCGCLTDEARSKGLGLKSGDKNRNRWYSKFNAMRARCYDPENRSYPNYGGRGIGICSEWLENPAAFRDYVGNPPFAGASIDRIDNDKGYEPGNVRWSTHCEQARNRRSTRLTPALVIRARALREEGLSVREIGEALSLQDAIGALKAAVKAETWADIRS